MGGIKTNVSCETSMTNLYACGEIAQANLHGANRLGGNSLLEIITMGRRAGREAARVEEKEDVESLQQQEDKEHIERIYEYSNEINFYKEKSYLGNSLFNIVGLYREEEKLKFIINQLKQYQNNITKMGISDKSKLYNKNLVEFLEFQNILEVALLVSESALKRRESRGAHYRNDYNETKEAFNKETLLIKNGENHTLAFEEIK